MKLKSRLIRLLTKNRESPIALTAENRVLVKRVFLIGAVVTLLVIFSAVLTWRAEYTGDGSNTVKSFWDGIWWAVVTIATVGYGDKFPVTVFGRSVGIILIMSGYVLLSVFTGLITSSFVEDRLKGAKGLKPIRASHHIILCGWNQTAETLLHALVEKNISDIVIGLVTNQTVEFFEAIESRFPTLQLRFVRGEPTQEDVLRRASVQTADQVIILADQSLSSQSADDRSIIIANAIHFISRKVNVTVQLMNGANRNLLHRIGIESIIVYDELGGYLLANTTIENRFLEMYEHLAKDHEQKLSMVRIPEQLVGKTYGEVFDCLYKEQKLLCIGIFSKEPDLDINDIFTDDGSAIDQFIKASLSKSKAAASDKKTSICWNPDRGNIVSANDLAIVMN